MLGEVIGHVIGAASPVDDEITGSNTIFDPIKTHVHGLGAFLLDGAIDNTRSSRIIGLDVCGWLRMSHVNEGLSENSSFLAVVK